jgi:hypothetical protein
VSRGPSNNHGGEFREVSPRAIYQLHLTQLDASRLSVTECVDEDLDNDALNRIQNARGVIGTHERSCQDAFVRHSIC